jgi:hypothetical protein
MGNTGKKKNNRLDKMMEESNRAIADSQEAIDASFNNAQAVNYWKKRAEYWKNRALATEPRSSGGYSSSSSIDEPFAPAPGPATHNMDSGDSRISNFDSQLSQQMGQGIGSEGSNTRISSLTLDAEEQQAKAVGEEAGLEEKLRLNKLEESSGKPTSQLGPDKSGKYIPILRGGTPLARDFRNRLIYDPRDGKPMHDIKVRYGYNLLDRILGQYHKVDMQSLSITVYNHAKNSRINFGTYYDVGIVNPAIMGDDFIMHFYTSFRLPGEGFFYGLLHGPTVELTFFKPVSKERVEQVILAIESEGAAARKSAEENA